MNHEFWLERWRKREIGWHLDEINAHLQEHWPRLEISPGTPVLVPLCGKTLDLFWLAGQGYPVTGIELSQIAVEELFAEQGLTPTITQESRFQRYQVEDLRVLCGDFFALRQTDLEGVGAVFDRASLIAMPAEMREPYVRQMRHLFPEPVETLLITLSYDQTEMGGPPFSVHEDEVDRLYGDTHRIEQLSVYDALDDSPSFRRRGLTALSEQVYHLRPRR